MTLLSPEQWLSELAVNADPVAMFRQVVGEPDLWQEQLLRWPNGIDHPLNDPMLIALCSRGTGKSQTIAIKALHHVDTTPGACCIIIAPSQRQSIEQYRYIRLARDKLPLVHPSTKETETEMHFSNGSRIIVLPGSTPDNIRGYRCTLLLLEESARISDEIFQAAVPMMLTHGKIICATTPAGQHGFTYDLFTEGRTSRIIARSTEIPRLSAIVERDRKIMRKAAFECEHMLRWYSSGENYFDTDLIEAAFTNEIEVMQLPWN